MVDYYILDPIGTPVSGITQYTKNACIVLKQAGINCIPIHKNDSEDIESFRFRVRDFFLSMDTSKPFIIESPETLASTKYLPNRFFIHIRLHFSKVLGAYLYNKPISKSVLHEEAREIERASIVSSPSYVGLYFADKFFHIKKPSIYPNPTDVQSKQNKKEPLYDVGFIGRWQDLKGIFFIKKLIERNRLLNFGLVSGELAEIELKAHDNVKVLGESDAAILLRSCKCVVIPSLFETASMVGLEALANNVSVVAWSHLGICEYSGKPYVYAVPPLDFCCLEKVIYEAIGGFSGRELKNSDFLTSINNSFVQGVVLALNLKNHKSPALTKKTSRVDLGRTIEKIRHMKKYNEITPFKRKLRKLNKDPVLFFSDMYKKRKGEIAIPIPVMKSSSYAIVKTIQSNDLFCNIKDWGEISFHDYGKKNSGHRVVFIFDAYLYKQFTYKNILEEVYSHDDFSPLRRSELGRGYCNYFDHSSRINSITLLDSINDKEKNKVNNLRNIFLFDCFDPNVFELFRSLSPNLSINAIYTGCLSEEFLSNPSLAKNIDCLVMLAGEEVSVLFRKVYVYKKIEYLHLICRKVIQESLEKSPTYLLPLYGDFIFSEDLDKFNTDLWGGLIVLKENSPEITLACNFSAFINLILPNIEYIYIKEEIYLKYKTLCDDIYNDGYLGAFLQYSLLDGDLYDVKRV